MVEHPAHPRVLPGMVHGALLQLVTGVVLVGLHEAGAGDDDVNNAKIGVKLLVTLVVVGLAWVTAAGPQRPGRRSLQGSSTPSAG